MRLSHSSRSLRKPWAVAAVVTACGLSVAAVIWWNFGHPVLLFAALTICAVSLLSILMARVAAANARAVELADRLADDLRARLTQQAALSEISRWSLGISDQAHFLEQSLAAACRAAHASCGTILLLDADGSNLRLATTFGWPERPPGEVVVPVGEGTLAGFPLVHGRAVLVPDARNELRFHSTLLPEGPLALGGLSVPIRSESQRFGVMCLHCAQAGGLTEADLNFAVAVAQVLALALARSKMEAAIEAQRAEGALMALVAAHTDHAAIITDAAGLIEWVNDGFTHLTGYTLAETKGRKPGSILQGPDTDRDRVRVLRERIAAGQPFVVELVNYHKSGRAYWVAVDGQPIRDQQGKLVRFISINRDISARKSAEQVVANANAALRDRNSEMEQFVGTVSHDLKSPLVTMAGFLSRLQRLITPPPPTRSATAQADSGQVDLPGARDALRRVEDAVERMRLTIDELLALARTGRCAGPMGLVDMDGLIRTLARGLEDRVADQGAQLSIVGPLPSVHGDHGRLVELFENLLSNALKYGCATGGDPGRVVIGSRRLAGEVQFFVADSGPGIPPEFHERIFDLFQRLDSSKEGTGLGLAIVRKIARAHGGHAWVESTPGRGSQFWVSLPDEPGGQVARRATRRIEVKPAAKEGQNLATLVSGPDMRA